VVIGVKPSTSHARRTCRRRSAPELFIIRRGLGRSPDRSRCPCCPRRHSIPSMFFRQRASRSGRRLDNRPDLEEVLRVLLWPVETGIPLPKHRLVLHAKAVHIDADVLVHLQNRRPGQAAKEIAIVGSRICRRGVSRSYQRRIAGAPVRQRWCDNALVVGRRRPNTDNV